jgi:hypothetical protein
MAFKRQHSMHTTRSILHPGMVNDDTLHAVLAQRIELAAGRRLRIPLMATNVEHT